MTRFLTRHQLQAWFDLYAVQGGKPPRAGRQLCVGWATDQQPGAFAGAVVTVAPVETTAGKRLYQLRLMPRLAV